MTARSLDSRRETLKNILRDRLSRIKVRIVYSRAGPTHAQPPDELSTKQAARAVTRWENEGGRTLSLDRRPRATK